MSFLSQIPSAAYGFMSVALFCGTYIYKGGVANYGPDTTGETPHTSTNGRCRMGMEQERISDKDLQVEGCNEISPFLTTWCPRLSECCYF
jgi:hypothetical protein